MNEIISEILAQYEEIRYKNGIEEGSRLEKAYEECPELSVVDKKIAKTRNALAASIFSENQEDKQKQEKALNELNEKREKLLSQFEKGYLNPVYSCKKCRDTGFLKSKKKCSCLEKKINEYKFKEHFIEKNESFDSFDLELFPNESIGKITQREQMRRIKNRLLKYVSVYPENSQRTLVFLGGTGLGKTFILKCMLRELAYENTCIYTSAYKMFNDFHKDRLSEQTDIDLYFEAECLFIDDLTSEPVTKNVTIEYFFNLLNERIRCKKHTFIASNSTIQGLKDRYGDAVFSRLGDQKNSAIYILEGKDIRVNI